jgi:hypothetical protein
LRVAQASAAAIGDQLTWSHASRRGTATGTGASRSGCSSSAGSGRTVDARAAAPNALTGRERNSGSVNSAAFCWCHSARSQPFASSKTPPASWMRVWNGLVLRPRMTVVAWCENDTS